MTLAAYSVKVTFAHPAWDEVNGFTYTVMAESKSQAIRYARRYASRDGHMGRLTFRATKLAEA